MHHSEPAPHPRFAGVLARALLLTGDVRSAAFPRVGVFVGVFVARFVGVTCPSNRVDVRRARVDLRTGAASDLSSVDNRNTSCTHMPRRSTPIATTAVTVAGSDMSSLSSCMVAAGGERAGQCAR